MKLFGKKFTAMAMAALMTAAMSTGVLGEEPATTPAAPLTAATQDNGDKAPASTAISVQLNGSTMDLSNAAPVNKDGSVFIPARAILEALDAEVGFDASTGTVTAKKGDTAITMVVGEKDVLVDTAGTSATVTMDAPSFILDGSTLVPVRFAAEVLGCSVGWDASTNTVLLADTSKIVDPIKDKFTIMDKYLAYSKKYTESPYAITGNFKLKYDVNAGEIKLPISASGKIDGLTDAEKMDMKMDMVFDLSKIKLPAEATDADKAEIEAMKNMLQSVKLNLRMDMNSGKYYIGSPLFEKLMNLPSNSWMEIDFNELFASSGMGSFSDLMKMTKIDSFAGYVENLAKTIPLTNTSSYATIKATVDSLYKMFGDESLEKVGDNYVSTYEETADGVSAIVKTTFMAKDDAIVGYAMDMTTSMDGKDIMTMNMVQDENDKVKMTMTMNAMDILSMDMSMDMKYTKSTKTPSGVPDKGSNIISVMDMFQNMMTPDTAAEATSTAPAPDAEENETTEAPAPENTTAEETPAA